MKRKMIRIGLALGVGFAFVALLFLTVQVSAQDQTIDLLGERLKQHGVPIRSITVQSRVPLMVEVTLVSSGSGKDRSLDDLWFEQLTRREISLAHRLGIRIDGYRLVLVNAKGETLNWELNRLLPFEPSQRQDRVVGPTVNDQTAAELLRNGLVLQRMTLDWLNVSTDALSGGTGQFVMMQLSVADLEAANQSLLAFLGSLRPLIDNLNAGSGTRIVICWVRLLDLQGRVLLNYIWDAETREETSTAAPGLVQWSPRPRPGTTPTAPPHALPATPSPNPRYP